MHDFFVYIGDFLYNLFKNLFAIDRWYLDILDIALVALILYYAIKFVRETRAAQLVKGILLLLVFYILSSILNLTAISSILRYIFKYGLIAIVLIFQPEIRRVLEKIGRSKLSVIDFFSKPLSDDADSMWGYTINSVCEACYKLSCDKVGALIVIEQKTKLGESVERAALIDSIPSVSLITSIFFPNSPLHDGGLIIRDGRLYAASCFFQPSDKVENISLGSRHRAALGISEVSDSIVIVVSEETGIISVANEGKLIQGFSKETLKSYLNENMLMLETDEAGNAVKKKQPKIIKKTLGRRKNK